MKQFDATKRFVHMCTVSYIFFAFQVQRNLMDINLCRIHFCVNLHIFPREA